ncbi:MAG: PSD1 domain-containing protein [Planctomycetaceae bacterium]|nr:PSD1 domain-containing protein [Planctomycetaceae bacterium]
MHTWSQAFLILFSGIALLNAPALATAAELTSAEQEAFFEKHIRPVLVEKCNSCHGEKKQWAELRLDSRRRMLKGGESGPAIVPGKSAESLIILAITHSDEASEMPPEEDKLLEEQIANFIKWVDMGSPWPASDSAEEELDYFEQAKTHWAFQPVRKPAVPQLPGGFRSSNAIDHFIARKLKQANQKQSPVANPRTLLRRLEYDITGLPAEYKTVQEFSSHPSPENYAAQVDRLLGSVTYGQKWGRYWLDLARYADTKGYVFTEERRYPYAYTYRDYVIESLNQDLPYDQFIREQLAADLLPEKRNEKSLAALGFLTVGPRFLNRTPDIYDDRIDVTIRGLQGLTIACARCHDHKYDPLNMADYYALYGVFASSTEPAELPQIGLPVSKKAHEEYLKQVEKIENEIVAYNKKTAVKINQEIPKHFENYLIEVLKKAGHKKGVYQLDDKYQVRRQVQAQWLRYLAARPVSDPVFGILVQLSKIKDEQFETSGQAELDKILQQVKDGAYAANEIVVARVQQTKLVHHFDLAKLYGKLSREALTDLAGKPEGEQAAWKQLREAFDETGTPGAYTAENVTGVINRAERNVYNNLKKKINALTARSPGAPPRAMVLNDKPKPVTPVIFKRGNAGMRGDKVPRRFLEVLSSVRSEPFSDKSSGRLGLAQAISSPENPLTARVLVNRIWMQLIGKALVSETSDFGLRTAPPTHPELLDYLSAEFVAHNWSIKWLVREIVLSETYRQSSLANEAGLNADSENQLVWRMNRKRMTFEGMRDSMLFTAGLLNIDLNGQAESLEGKTPTHRRAIYGFIDRNNVSQLLRTFNVAGPSSSVSQRPRTTVPQQALFGMNSPFVMSLAESITKSVDTKQTTPAIEQLYRKVYHRDPAPDETAWCKEFIESQTENKNAWQELAQALLLSNEFMFID